MEITEILIKQIELVPPYEYRVWSWKGWNQHPRPKQMKSQALLYIVIKFSVKVAPPSSQHLLGEVEMSCW